MGRVANESPGICTERPRPAGSQPHQSCSDILSQSNLALGLARPSPRCWSPALSPRQGGVAAKWQGQGGI